MPSFARRWLKIRQIASRLVKKCERHFVNRRHCSRTLIESSVRCSSPALLSNRNPVRLLSMTFLPRSSLGARIGPSGLLSLQVFWLLSPAQAFGFSMRRLELDLFLQWLKSFSRQYEAARSSLRLMTLLTTPDSKLLYSLLLQHQTPLSL